jgi:hypothetical protein
MNPYDPTKILLHRFSDEKIIVSYLVRFGHVVLFPNKETPHGNTCSYALLIFK